MIKRRSIRRLLAPTVGLRQAVLIGFVGLLLFSVGSALSFRRVIEPGLEWLRKGTENLMSRLVSPDSVPVAAHFLGGAFLLLGLYLMFLGARNGVRTVFETVNPGAKGELFDEFVRRQQLAEGPRIVALGGGTGLSTLLRGLKQHSSNITAIVTVTDDGGSSGRLIQDKGMIPPGDIRNCLVALADAEKSMTDLFQHRFKEDSGSLSGHSIGNLLLAALSDQAKGDFEQAVEMASQVLNIRGRVIPATLSHVSLKAQLDNGTEVHGETSIVSAGSRIRKILLEPENASANKIALAAIMDADLVVIGPGSVFTSVVPNLLVPGIAEAVKGSSAIKVYVCNVMTQPGESEGFSASEHVTAILNCVETRCFDWVMVNTGIPREELLLKYRGSGQHLVSADVDLVKALGFRTLTGDFMSESDVVRHDPMRVASKLVSLLERRR